MQVRITQKEQNNQYTSFKGPTEVLTTGLHFLNANPAIACIGIDAASMGLPRTAIDSTRGFDAATETAVREFSSTLNFALLGIWGVGAATILGKLLNSKYPGLKADQIYANGSTIEALGELYNNAQTSKGHASKAAAFAADFCDNLQILNGEEWRRIEDSTAKNKIVGILEKAITDDSSAKYSLGKEAKQKLTAIITSESGGNQACKLKIGSLAPIDNSLSSTLDHFVAVGRSFVKAGGENVSQELITGLKRNKLAASLCGLAIPIAIGVSMQPINRWLTKLRTGKEGFVGVQGEQADNSPGFKFKKLLAAIGMGAFATASIGERSIAKLSDRIQFSGVVPNLAQFKMIYGLTIMSRMAAARDGNELRETCIKDTLGFANWLLLGGFVSKLVARAYGDKNLLNYDTSEFKQGRGSLYKFWHWITNTSVKSSEEILFEELKKAKHVFTGDEASKSFKQLLELLPEKAKTRINCVNKAQLAGYAYSALALGIGVPFLNIFITNKLHKKISHKGKNTASAPQPKLNQLNPYFMDSKTLQKIQSNHA